MGGSVVARDPRDPPKYEPKDKNDKAQDAYDWARAEQAKDDKKKGSK
jgi:hypothetical protein